MHGRRQGRRIGSSYAGLGGIVCPVSDPRHAGRFGDSEARGGLEREDAVPKGGLRRPVQQLRDGRLARGPAWPRALAQNLTFPRR